MKRDELKAFFELVGKVGDALADLPHRAAMPALSALQEMSDIVGEQLPGGYCGECPTAKTLRARMKWSIAATSEFASPASISGRRRK